MKRNWILVSLLVIAAGCASKPKPASSQGAEMSSSHLSGSQTGTVVGNGLTPYNAEATILKQDMRKLWTEHVVWTRCYIIAALGDQPDATAAATRLMRNQEDIGNAAAKYYGPAAGQKLTALLKDHISISADVIKAAKNGDKTSLQEANDRWNRNALEIADFLSDANPYWPRATLAEMMKMHLSTTTDEVTARLNKDWDADVRAFDKVYDHILKMSDALTDGIVKQFPARFTTVHVSSS